MLNKRLILLFIIVFLLGWTANTIYGYITQDNSTHYDINLGASEVVIDNFSEEKEKTHLETTKEEKFLTERFFDKDSIEKPSPYDRIKESQIHVQNNKVIIDINDPEWAAFTDTNSMDPVFDYGTNAIEIVPNTPDEIHVGDIISYRSEYADGVIIHRVIQIAEDENGWYAILKGDNNKKPDPGKIRFHQIERVLVAIIY